MLLAGAPLEAHHQLGAAHSVAIHFGTFRLSDEGMGDPPRDLDGALDEDQAKRGVRARFVVLREGEGWDVPPMPAAEA